MTSKLRDMVEEEVARAEAEADDEDEGDEPVTPDVTPEELEDEPDDDPELSMEAKLRAFERENDRHAHELGLIMGDDFAAFEGCPTCNTIGWRPIVAMQVDPGLEQCPHCKGHGFLLTGAVREDRVLRECLDCQGNGYRARPAALPPQAAPPPDVPRFDPYTGLPVAANGTGYVVQPEGTWAPGFVPPGTGHPAPRPGS